VIGADVRATEANAKSWEKLLVNPDFPETEKEDFRQAIARMRANKGRFISNGADQIDTFPAVLPYPKKVVVLIDKGCGSTTEQFLLEARQSKKVTLMGQSSLGVLDYANVREGDALCPPFEVYYPTTRSRRVDIGEGIDNVGIAPRVKLGNGGSWVEEADRYFDKD
jgi:C-terminal processing protease CtpA/Prc